MAAPRKTPPHPKIYHITHVNNLRAILKEGALISDSAILNVSRPTQGIGMSTIKRRRLGLPVACNPRDKVGDYVPFYFCPRSIMLYVIHCANHPELSYRGGQEPIVHLEADLQVVVDWAKANGRRWAFSLTNAGANYTQFRSDLTQLEGLNWAAITATDFRDPDVKEGKQAEFLLHGDFPWTLISRIGVHSAAMAERVKAELDGHSHTPLVDVQPKWYFENPPPS